MVVVVIFVNDVMEELVWVVMILKGVSLSRNRAAYLEVKQTLLEPQDTFTFPNFFFEFRIWIDARARADFSSQDLFQSQHLGAQLPVFTP